MGCQSSIAVIIPQTDYIRKKSLSLAKEFGPDIDSINGKSDGVWRTFLNSADTRAAFQHDGETSTIGCKLAVELRSLLNDPIGTQYFELFMNKNGLLDAYECWKRIVNWNGEGAVATLIYQKYVKRSANIVSANVSTEECVAICEAFITSEDGGGSNGVQTAHPKMFEWLEHECFVVMLHMYEQFKTTEQFAEMSRLVRNTYNKASPGDFKYFSVLGCGGFGLVVHCCKISTGVHYAMKIQTKESMYEERRDAPWRVINELQAFASCNHPFIVDLHYAFQSKTLAMLVMTLGTCGDLSRALKNHPMGRLPMERVLLYSAEITSALCYLHNKGFIYRDLKPGNILLMEDGHIKLVDFGAVANLEGKALQSCVVEGSAPYFLQDEPVSQSLVSDGQTSTHRDFSDYDSEHIVNRQRATTVAGTNGYMAPEIVILLSQPCVSPEDGYTHAVDWWSLGVTMFKLLVGTMPYPKESSQSFGDFENRLLMQDMARYLILFESVDYSALDAFPLAKDMIQQLLQVQVAARLGSGPGNSKLVQQHPFFASMDWDKVLRKEITPVYLPRPTTKTSTGCPAKAFNFKEMMRSVRAEQLLIEKPILKQIDSYFSNWSFASVPSVLLEQAASASTSAPTSTSTPATSSSSASASTKVEEGASIYAPEGRVLLNSLSQDSQMRSVSVAK